MLQSGVGPVAASKLLGIGRKTGYRWRAENPRKRLDWRSPARAMAAELAS